MTLDNIMTMAKADRYTEEGRQIVNDARRTYKPGEISEATGLQKQSNGTWAPPKKGAPKGAKNTAKEKAAGAEIKEGQKEAAKTKPSEKWTSTPSGRVNTIKTPEGSATVTWNKEKNGEEWYGISTVKNHKMNSSDKHYKTIEEAKVAAEEELQGKQKDPMEEMRNTDRPLSTMENQIDEGSYDDAIIESEGDSTAIMDISRDILSPAFDAVPDQEIPESWLKAARDSVRKRYTALRKDVMGDSAPRTLTGDTKIRVKK